MPADFLGPVRSTAAERRKVSRHVLCPATRNKRFLNVHSRNIGTRCNRAIPPTSCVSTSARKFPSTSTIQHGSPPSPAVAIFTAKLKSVRAQKRFQTCLELSRATSAKHFMKQLTEVIIFTSVSAERVLSPSCKSGGYRFSASPLDSAGESQKRRGREKNALFKRISIREKTRQMGSYVVRLLSCRRFNDGLLPLLSVLITTGFDIVTASALYHGRRAAVDCDISNVARSICTGSVA